jgi:hypothetical protein
VNSEVFKFPNNWYRDVTTEMPESRDLGSQCNNGLICRQLQTVILHLRGELPITKKLDVCETSLDK